MSTRASIIITDSYGTKLYFYRHSDGYPETTGEDLKEFCKGYQKNLRNNASQSAGWLIVRGNEGMRIENQMMKEKYPSLGDLGKGYEWKVGHYEPTDQIHGDVEYVYVIDLDAMILETRAPRKGFWEAASLSKTKIIETYSISENPGVIAKRGAK